jgi:hypothetical protein
MAGKMADLKAGRTSLSPKSVRTSAGKFAASYRHVDKDGNRRVNTARTERLAAEDEARTMRDNTYQKNAWYSGLNKNRGVGEEEFNVSSAIPRRDSEPLAQGNSSSAGTSAKAPTKAIDYSGMKRPFTQAGESVPASEKGIGKMRLRPRKAPASAPATTAQVNKAGADQQPGPYRGQDMQLQNKRIIPPDERHQSQAQLDKKAKTSASQTGSIDQASQAMLQHELENRMNKVESELRSQKDGRNGPRRK